MSISRDKRQGRRHTLAMLSGIAAGTDFSGLAAGADQQKGGLRIHHAYGNEEFRQREDLHPSSSRNSPPESRNISLPGAVSQAHRAI